MLRALTLHHDQTSPLVSAIDIEVARPSEARLALRYRLTGATESLRIPALAAPERTDGLWRSTCFEIFVLGPDRKAYLEFNFAPSSAWAAYRFDDYRLGMAEVKPLDAPRIACHREAAQVTLEVDLSLGDLLLGDLVLGDLALGDRAPPQPWTLAISAVVEDIEGAKTYWALAHPPGKPDFHHQDGFVLQLPAA